MQNDMQITESGRYQNRK